MGEKEEQPSSAAPRDALKNIAFVIASEAWQSRKHQIIHEIASSLSLAMTRKAEIHSSRLVRMQRRFLRFPGSHPSLFSDGALPQREDKAQPFGEAGLFDLRIYPRVGFYVYDRAAVNRFEPLYPQNIAGTPQQFDR